MCGSLGEVGGGFEAPERNMALRCGAKGQSRLRLDGMSSLVIRIDNVNLHIMTHRKDATPGAPPMTQI